MNKKWIFAAGLGMVAVALGVMVACESEYEERKIIWDDPSYLPDTTYINPVFKPVLADPTVIRAANGTFYAYGTEDTWDAADAVNGETHHIVAIVKSNDLVNWVYVGDAFTDETKPNWGTNGAGVWAPQIYQGQDGQYYLYYSLSTWGDSDPGIGVATAASPEGPFTDQGKILRSQEIGVGNSIDPFFITTGSGRNERSYLFWGSFQGIYAIQMQDEKTIKAGAVPQQIANNLYEATYIYEHDGYFYFFGSMGSCCEGADSKYRVKVARSTDILGPYLNESGQDIKTNGVEGKAFLTGDASLGFVGPGHNAEIFTDSVGHYFIPYHAVDISKGNGLLEGGATRRPLMLDEITWVDGWPVVNAGTSLEGKPSNTPKRSPDFGSAMVN